MSRIESQVGANGGHAIVVGASMAGLLAARVLSDHFGKVTLIERDEIVDGSEPRKGVPQGAHAHALLSKGLEIISALFPGMHEDLIAGGAVEADVATVAWHQCGVWKLRVPSNIRGMAQSRPFLEWQVRRRVAQLPGVIFLAARRVVGLLVSKDGASARGVELAAGDGRELLEADLVVDAAGRGSQAPEWLAAIGHARPQECEVGIDIAYATRLYRRTGLPDYKAMILYPSPPAGKRLGFLFPIEHGRWMCTLGGLLGDHAPTDDRGYLEFARTLPVQDLYDVIRGAEPLGVVRVHKIPTSRWRRYDKLRGMPGGFLVIGDAVCSFNPIYGQGMTVSALEALALDACLREQADGRDRARLIRRFHRRTAQIVAAAWRLATGEDFQYPETEGHRPLGTVIVNAYVARLHKRVACDPEVLLSFYRVVHMLASPTSLFHPRIVLRVLAGRGKRAAPASSIAEALLLEGERDAVEPVCAESGSRSRR